MKVYVKRLDTREVVSEMEVNPLTTGQHERFMLGLLRNMDTNSYFVDDEEVIEQVYRRGETA